VTRVLISGWYGNGNLGDEAVLAGMLRAIRAADPTIEPVVLSDNPVQTASEHGVRARGRSNSGHRRRLLSEVWALPSHDALVIGGGGLIKDFGREAGNVHAWLRPGIAAGLIRRKCMWYAIGVDDIRHSKSEAVVRRAAARADLITLRDEGSADMLRTLGVQRELLVTADPAVLLAEPIASWRTEEHPLVAVCPRRWKSTGADVERPDLEERLLREFAAALDGLAERQGARVLMVPFRSVPGDDDAEVCRRLAAQMRNGGAVRITEVPTDAVAAAKLLSQCQLVVGTRLHSLILAAGAAVPFYALDYMPKVRFFAERLGLTHWASGLERAAAPEHLAGELAAALEARADTRSHLLGVVHLLRRLSSLDGALLACVLRDPRRVSELVERARDLVTELRKAAGSAPVLTA
jgi:polysaccharide pyruvyl transferase CsaB